MKYDDYTDILTTVDDTNKLQYDLSGIAQTPDFYTYKKYYKQYIITPGNQYRPDKIAFELLGDPSLDWIIDSINFISHDKEYKMGKSISYLDRDTLKRFGII